MEGVNSESILSAIEEADLQELSILMQDHISEKRKNDSDQENQKRLIRSTLDEQEWKKQIEKESKSKTFYICLL